MPIQVRASSFSDLFDCPKRWAAEQIDGLKTPTHVAAHMGTAIHVGTAVLDGGGDLLEADDAAQDALDNPDDEVFWASSNRDKAGVTVTDALVAYETWPERDSYARVELEAAPLLHQASGGAEIEITGTIDRVRQVGNHLGIDDVKTGARVISPAGNINTNKHRLQLGIYELLADNTLGPAVDLPARIIGIKTSPPVAVQVAEAGDCKTLIHGDDTTEGALDHASRLLQSGAFYGNSRSALCSQLFCPVWATCHYR